MSVSALDLVNAFGFLGARACILLRVFFFAFGLKKVPCASRDLYAVTAAAAPAAAAVLESLGLCLAFIVKCAVRVTCLSAVLRPSFSAFTSRRHLSLSFAIMSSERQEFVTGTSIRRSPSLRFL